MIQYINVERTYQSGGQVLHALRGVTLSIEPGEFVAIAGKSGSGKTTLLNLASGIDHPSAGEVIVAGRNLDTLSDHELTLMRRQTVGMIFQFFNLIPTLDALQNVALPCYLTGQSTTRAHELARQHLFQMGLGERLTEFPDQLSGGEQQRVAIARAMINNPPIILADEPTGNLDTETGNFVLIQLQRLSREEGKTVLMVTHSPEALSFVDRVVRVKDGQLEE